MIRFYMRARERPTDGPSGIDSWHVCHTSVVEPVMVFEGRRFTHS